MGKGAKMFVYNLDTNSQKVNGVTSSQCMYDHGAEGSNISLWNGQTIAPQSAIPSNGWKAPQYIEADGHWSFPCGCACEQSQFTLGFQNGASVELKIQTAPVPVNESSRGNVVCSLNSSSSLSPWSGQPGIGIMILPDPAKIPPREHYVPINPACWMEVFNNKVNGKFFNLPLNMVSLPASHDAGTSVATKCTSLASTAQTQTQTLDIGGQLNAGIRYFDLRPCVWDIHANNGSNDFYFGHFTSAESGQGCLGQNMVQALQQVAWFIKTNTQEVVILKFSHYVDNNYNSLPANLQLLMIETIQKQLGKALMYTASMGERVNATTLNTIVQSSRRVICIFDQLDNALYNPSMGILRFGDLASQAVHSNVYYQEDNGAVYLLMDEGLRHVPDPQTWRNLAGSVPINPSLFNTFKNADSAPYPFGPALMENAQLVNIPTDPESIYLTDISISNPGQVILRPVVSPAQLHSYAFHGTVQSYGSSPVYGSDVFSPFYSNFDVYDSYSDTDNLAIMVADQIDKYKKFLNGVGNNWQKDGMFLLSYTLTQTTFDAILSALGYGTVLTLATYANRYLWTVITSIMKGPTNQQPPNLIYIDAVDNANAVSAAFYLNLQNVNNHP